MFKVYTANSRHTADHGWLKSNFSFSFANYNDPSNVNFGSLRVLNDDIVQPNKGFGAHPHRDMEIVSLVLKGYLKHEDNTGDTATTTFGGVQRMTAGTGIVHSEVNPSSTEEVSFLQLWFTPERTGLTPSYQQTNFDLTKMENQLLPIVSYNPDSQEIAHIHQDLTIYISDLKGGEELSFTQDHGRKIFIFVLEGELEINKDTLLKNRDSVRITDTPEIIIKAGSGSRFILIDLI
jgi:redox-sensitive bicupin YhaK (pirin superfamily)